MKLRFDWLRIIWWAAIIVLTLFYLCALFGCQTAQNLTKHNDKFPLAAAEYAHKKFPPKETHSIDTLYSSDTLYQEGPPVDTTVFCDTLYATKYVALKCPPTKIIHDTVRINNTNWMIDGAAVSALELQHEKDVAEKKKLQEQFAATKDKLSWWKIACLITWGILGIGIAFKIGFSLKKPPL